MDGFLSGVKEKYIPEILEGRKSVEGNVIACIWKDLLLIDEINLEPKDFITEDGIFYFSLARQLREKGYNVLDEVTVVSNISDFVETGFQDRGGWDTIQNLMDIINERNWDTYIDTLYRENIILNLYNSGFNLLKPVEENGKSIIPLNLFRKMDSESVLDWYEARLSNIGTGYTSKVLEECDLEITDQFLNDLEEGMENGVPFDMAGISDDGEEMMCLPYLSNHISGLMDGTLSMLGGYSSSGKTTLWTSIIMGLIYRDRKVLLMSNEQKSKVFKISFIVWILAKKFKYFKITKKKMLSGDFTDIDKEYLKKAQKYWNENYKGKIKFIAIPDSDMTIVKKKIREYALKYGFDTYLYDTFKISFDDDKGDNHWISLIKDSRELDKICKKYNLIGLASIQLALSTLGKLFLDASVLSLSKQIKEVLENLLLMRVVYPEELDHENKKYYCRPFRRRKIGDKWVEEEYEPDMTAVYRMVFVDKCRSGENSSDTGVAMLLKFMGNTGTFVESAYCRPRHGFIG